jgi:cobalt-zinc-cadmium efflux system membrane fusion protein
MRLIMMNSLLRTILSSAVLLSVTACDMAFEPESMDEAAAGDYERGPSNGRMLRDGNFAIELAIFETGVPPEFRAWATDNGQPVDPADVDLTVTLTRLGAEDEVRFSAQGDYLRGNQTVYEPHSFLVTVEANRGGRSHEWQYESFEGRTRIAPDMAEAFGIETMIAGPATLAETITAYGSIVPNPERVREVSARFDGAIQSVDVALSQMVSEGQRLATVESNESLQSYAISAPISGIVMERTANAGEQTNGRRLFRIVDTSNVWAEIAIFPSDRARVAVGSDVEIAPATGGESIMSSISHLSPVANANQSITARVPLENADGRWALGSYVTASIKVAEIEVPLAVKRNGLQSFRDFTVVYAQIGDQYEVRMLDLGRQDDEWIEVLGGLRPGTRYVTENSYVLKADVEKSGASHDH